MFKVNNNNPRSRCEIYSKLSIKTPERRPQNGQTNVKNLPPNAAKFITCVEPFCGRRSGVFIDNFEHIYLFLVFLLLDLGMYLLADTGRISTL